MARHITAEQAGDNLKEVLEGVHAGNEPVIVESGGQPFAVIISPELWERYRDLTKQRFFETVDELRRENRGMNPETVMRDVTAAVEEVRQQRYEREHRPPPDRH